ncbi:hypothetical protein B0J12DRAFT_214903 [Macrophomina phaseolina]|uniref:Uncharacterized protein n=1 Tax=Macrophomina phaseolina TaxID=35725 RepID=A0ABQ8G1L7_9PEZI|nr:hypothetical protein B0J12DRAFT_214903 [Macrophomina phaseolina]
MLLTLQLLPVPPCPSAVVAQRTPLHCLLRPASPCMPTRSQPPPLAGRKTKPLNNEKTAPFQLRASRRYLRPLTAIPCLLSFPLLKRIGSPPWHSSSAVAAPATAMRINAVQHRVSTRPPALVFLPSSSRQCHQSGFGGPEPILRTLSPLQVSCWWMTGAASTEIDG